MSEQTREYRAVSLSAVCPQLPARCGLWLDGCSVSTGEQFCAKTTTRLEKEVGFLHLLAPRTPRLPTGTNERNFLISHVVKTVPLRTARAF